MDGLEIERRLPREAFFALMAEAKTAGLPVGGKVPIELTPAEVSNAGQSTIDNLETLFDGQFRAAHAHDMDAAMAAFLAPGGDGEALFATLQRNGTAVTPCLRAFSSALAHDDSPNAPDPEFVSSPARTAGLRNAWRRTSTVNSTPCCRA